MIFSKMSCLTSEEIRKKLKEAGVRPTAQRVAICRYVLCQADHPTVEQVKEWADANFPQMSLATVYNTLHLLVEAGLLKAVKLSHCGKVFYDSNVRNHHHFLDEKTGRLYDVSPDHVQISSNLDGQFHVREVEVLLKGTRS